MYRRGRGWEWLEDRRTDRKASLQVVFQPLREVETLFGIYNVAPVLMKSSVQALASPSFLCFAFWLHDRMSPHAQVHFVKKKHRDIQNQEPELKKGNE